MTLDEKSELQTSTSSSDRRFSILSSTPLRALPMLLSEAPTRFALVENHDGLITAIIDIQRVCELLTAENEVERHRWEEMPVGNVAEVLIPCSHAAENLHTFAPVSGPADSISIVHDIEGTAAVIIGGETFVNWNRVNGAIIQTYVDPVTQLPIRRSFNRRFREELDRAARIGWPLALCLIDLDQFKLVNDSHGHQAGDNVLRIVAKSLRSAIRSYDFVARYGGDEFVVLLTGCDPDKINLPISRLLEAYDRHLHSFNPTNINVALSIGVAAMQSVGEGCCPEKMLESADICLYHAKRCGGATSFVVELDATTNPIYPVQELVVAHPLEA